MKDYSSGYYHQDLIDAFEKKANCFFYGPGYPNYSQKDNIDDVIAKSPFNSDVDLIVVATSWELEAEDVAESDPHPNINLGKISNIPKLFYLNKEYKKLSKKFEYAKKNRFDIVCTVHPDFKRWQDHIGIRFIQLPFGISLDRFRDFGLRKRWDFAFTGALHERHLDFRCRVKKEIFQNNRINQLSTHGLDALFKSSPLKAFYRKYSIFWAEFGARKVTGRPLLPVGVKYAKFLNRCKVFLNTPSAAGIFNTRNFELMATKTLILCPQADYSGILKDGENCMMFKHDMSDFRDKFVESVENTNKRSKIVEFAYKNVGNHSYDARVETVLKEVDML